MRVVVIKQFKDKHTNEMLREGDIFEVSAERFEEICEAGEYVGVIADESVAVPELEDMTVAELKEFGKTMFDMEFARGMKKADIIAEIRAKEEMKNE